MSAYSFPVLASFAFCGLLAVGCASASAEDEASASGAVVTEQAQTVVATTGKLAAKGLTMTASLEDEGEGHAAWLTLRRGTKSTKLACTSIGSVKSDGTSAMSSRCVAKALPSYGAGWNECAITLRVDMPSKKLDDSNISCRNDRKLTADQKGFLDLVFGGTPYEITEDLTRPDAPGEWGGALGVPLTLTQLGTKIETDPFALAGYFAEAARPVLGKVPTLDWGAPIAATIAPGPISSVDVFLEGLPQNTLAINVLAANRVYGARSINALDADGVFVSQNAFTKSVIAGLGAK